MRFLGYRIADWFGFRIDHAIDLEAARRLADVGLEPDLPEQGFVDFLDHRGKDLKIGGARDTFLTGQDLEQRIALLRRGTFIDDRLPLAMAFMNGARPGEDAGPIKPIEAHLA